MAPVNIPPEVWARIFFFVAPPLPFVGLEKESFAEDAKEWRGDYKVKGQWQDIDNLMLVSKNINELVSPTFWSYLVLATSARAYDLQEQIVKRPRPQRTAVYSMVKLLHLSSNSGANPSEDASCRILRKLPNVVHVHFISSPTALTPVTVLVSLAMRSQPYHAPLEGLTGLNVGNKNWEAVMLAVRNLALSLRRLEISSLHPNKPGASQEVYAAAQQTELRSLMYFKTASPPPRGDVWLEVALLDRWDLPYVTKLMVGASGGGSNESNTLSKLDWTETCERLCFVNLAEVKVNLRLIREMEELAELAFGLGVPVTSHLNAATFKTALDGTSGKGRCVSKTVTSVVIWEGTQREASPREDACLVELVNRDRLPSLEKVVWIAKSRDTSTMTWSGNLMTWLLALTRAGVEVIVQ